MLSNAYSTSSKRAEIYYTVKRLLSNKSVTSSNFKNRKFPIPTSEYKASKETGHCIKLHQSCLYEKKNYEGESISN